MSKLNYSLEPLEYEQGGGAESAVESGGPTSIELEHRD